MNTLLQKGAFGRKSENKTAKAVPQAPGRIFTPLKRGVNEIGLLAAIVSVLSIVLPARAQTPVFNCSCLSTQAVYSPIPVAESFRTFARWRLIVILPALRRRLVIRARRRR